MPTDLDFDADEFLKLPIAERVRLCRALTERARALSKAVQPNHRTAYAEIAKQWAELADEMERSSSAAHRNPG